MPKVQVWERRLDAEDDAAETPCPECRGRGDEDCLICGGEGVTGMAGGVPDEH